MLHWALLPVCALACMVGFRIRGGLLGPWHLPGQASRLVWAATFAATAYAGGAVWWHALALVPLMFATATLPLWGCIDFRPANGGYRRNVPVGAVHGLCLLAPAAAGAWWLGYPLWWLLAAAGPLFGPLYALAWLAPLTIPALGCKGASDPPPTGELLAGLIYGAAVFLAS